MTIIGLTIGREDYGRCFGASIWFLGTGVYARWINGRFLVTAIVDWRQYRSWKLFEHLPTKEI